MWQFGGITLEKRLNISTAGLNCFTLPLALGKQSHLWVAAVIRNKSINTDLQQKVIWKWEFGYLEAPGMYLATESQVLVFSLRKIDSTQTAEHFPNDVISGVTIKTQNHKVQRDTLYRQTRNSN